LTHSQQSVINGEVLSLYKKRDNKYFKLKGKKENRKITPL